MGGGLGDGDDGGVGTGDTAGMIIHPAQQHQHGTALLSEQACNM
jgi:hypothetical protein